MNIRRVFFLYDIGGACACGAMTLMTLVLGMKTWSTEQCLASAGFVWLISFSILRFNTWSMLKYEDKEEYEKIY